MDDGWTFDRDLICPQPVSSVKFGFGYQHTVRAIAVRQILGGARRLGVIRKGGRLATGASTVRNDPIATKSQRCRERREWDGPAALPPPTAFRARWGAYQEKERRHAS
jgi:hypothetical protein